MARFISPATKYRATTFLKGRPDGGSETMTVAHWFSLALGLARGKVVLRHDSAST
jgi:hypothetical protein